MTVTFQIINGKPTITKDPDATLDYTFDWTAYLADIDDTLSDVTFEVDDALNVESSSFTAEGLATAFVSGGTVGETQNVTCHITTTGGRIDDRTIWLSISDQ